MPLSDFARPLRIIRAFRDPAIAVRRHRVSPAAWARGPRLRLALVADLHCSDPWTDETAIGRVAAAVGAEEPDLVLLLGDYACDPARFRPVPAARWAAALAAIRAPLGVHAVLGNHDWWHDDDAQRRGGLPVEAGTALARAGIPVLHNAVARLGKDGVPFDLAGLGDQKALLARHGRTRISGLDDLDAVAAARRPGVPAILMAHEPDVFARLDDGHGFALVVSGHTHGGQVRLFGRPMATGSAFGPRYVHGHVVESGRHLVVSAGIGYARFPLRVGVPPEVVIVDLEPPRATEAQRRGEEAASASRSRPAEVAR